MRNWLTQSIINLCTTGDKHSQRLGTAGPSPRELLLPTHTRSLTSTAQFPIINNHPFRNPPRPSPIRLSVTDSWEKALLNCLKTHTHSEENVYHMAPQRERMFSNLRIFHRQRMGGPLSKHPTVCVAQTMLLCPPRQCKKRDKLLF